MSWNTKPQRAPLPPPYPQIQPAFSLQYAANQLSTVSQSSFSCPLSNQEGCMYLSNSNTVSQPLPNVRNYNVPLQIPASNMPSRTVVTSQTSTERTVYANAKGPMQPNHNLQAASGVMQNLRLKSSMMNSAPSQTEVTVSHQTHFGTATTISYTLQSQHTASDPYSVQVQVAPNSARGPVALQGSQGLNQSLSSRQVDWPQQHASDERTFPDYRPLPKQRSYSAQSFMQDPSVHKNILMPSAPSQITHNQLIRKPAPTQCAACHQTLVRGSSSESRGTLL
ncbi:retroelement silencing factor 1-like [Erethizon dorsatum]